MSLNALAMSTGCVILVLSIAMSLILVSYHVLQISTLIMDHVALYLLALYLLFINFVLQFSLTCKYFFLRYRNIVNIYFYLFSIDLLVLLDGNETSGSVNTVDHESAFKHSLNLLIFCKG